MFSMKNMSTRYKQVYYKTPPPLSPTLQKARNSVIRYN